MVITKMEPNGIFDKVVWNNICKYVTDYPTWIALSKCCKTTFNATRHGGGGNVNWKIESVSVLHKLLTAEYKMSIKMVSVPDLSVYTALCLAGLVIDSLMVIIPNDVFSLTKDSIYQGGNMLDELIIKRKIEVPGSGAGLYFFYLPPNLKKFEISIPEHCRFGVNIYIQTVFPEGLTDLTLHCGPVNYANDNDSFLMTLPDSITTFRFKDKHAFAYAPRIPIGIEILCITGEDPPEEANAIILNNVIYPKLRYLRLRNTLPTKDVTQNRIVRTSQFPNIERVVTHHVYLKNDAKLPFGGSKTLNDDCIMYKFNKEQSQKRKRLKIK